MTNRIEILHMAQQLAEHASARQSVVARNVAHANTPGFRQQDIASFRETYSTVGSADQMRATRSGHFGHLEAERTTAPFDVQGGTVSPNGNTVSLEDQILTAAEIRQQHEMALSIYRSGLSVIRASLGRR